MRFAALGLGLVLAWGLLEGTLRALSGQASGASRSVAVHENHRSSLQRPHVRTSQQRRLRSEKFRLLVVGDSFTWGVGVYHDDTYGRRLETLLERMNPELDVELTLFSRPGWNTHQEYEVLADRIVGLAPDLILLGYCLNDAEPLWRQGIEDLVEPLKRRRPGNTVGEFFYRRSRLVALVWGRLENSRQTRAFDSYYRKLYERAGWKTTLTALDGMRQLAWDAKAPLVVALFPVFDQPLDGDYSYLPLHRLVMNALRDRDIIATDLLPAYRGVAAVRLAVEPFTDPHPNELAHRIASQRLADFLVNEELVPVTGEQRDRVELSLRPRKRTETEQ